MKSEDKKIPFQIAITTTMKSEDKKGLDKFMQETLNKLSARLDESLTIKSYQNLKFQSSSA